MIAFPHAKINLGLHVICKRADGFHEIETVMIPVGWCDLLEAVPAGTGHLTMSGLPIPDDGRPNLCLQAVELVRAHRPSLPPVHIFLHKQIPTGAGLGGGSADAARTLVLLNDLMDLKFSVSELKEMAARLGSDCPFFVTGRPALARGRGELLQPIEVPALKGLSVLIACPPIHISTARAYEGLNPRPPAEPLEDILAGAIGSWPGRLVNDFEEVAMREHPRILQIREALYRQGALYASMSGSGPAVFGLFRDLPGGDPASLFPDCRTWAGPL
jgi:4-diphosphocytidyl-2-C-methyl-D-erythritol kinase